MNIHLKKRVFSVILAGIALSLYWIDQNSISSNNPAFTTIQEVTQPQRLPVHDIDQPEQRKQSDPAPTTVQPSSLGQPHRIIRIVDGDTVVVEIDDMPQKVRLIGINTPEIKTSQKPAECFGVEAENYARQLLANERVYVEPDPSQDAHDKYGRLLAYLILSNGTNFNERMIVDGYAKEYTYRKPYKYKKRFKEAETRARLDNKGLWHACAS